MQLIGLPLMVQDAPLSGVHLSVPFLVRVAKTVPLVNAFKIEVPGAAAKLRALREPDPYKGKGIRYANEVVRRKVGKKAGAGAK